MLEKSFVDLPLITSKALFPKDPQVGRKREKKLGKHWSKVGWCESVIFFVSSASLLTVCRRYGNVNTIEFRVISVVACRVRVRVWKVVFRVSLYIYVTWGHFKPPTVQVFSTSRFLQGSTKGFECLCPVFTKTTQTHGAQLVDRNNPLCLLWLFLPSTTAASGHHLIDS